MKLPLPFKFIFVLFSIAVMINCNNSEENILKIDDKQLTANEGNVEFGFTAPQLDASSKVAESSPSSSRTSQSHSRFENGEDGIRENAVSILISIEDDSGTPVYTEKVMKLARVGEDILSLPLSFSPGTYLITLFQVLDASNVAIAMTPREDSPFSGFVSATLDYSFTVTAENTLRVNLEVLSTKLATAADFGYSTFSFTAVDLTPFLVSVFTYDDSTNNFELTEATIEIKHLGNNRIYYNDNYDAQTLTFQIPDTQAEDIIQITASKSGYQSKTVTRTLADLKTYFEAVPEGSGPLIIVLEEDQASGGLVLHYDAANPASFSSSDTGRWYDLSGNNHHATLRGVNYVSEYGGGIQQDAIRSIRPSILVGRNPAYNSRPKITLEAWVKKGRHVGSSGAPYQFIFSNARDCCSIQSGYNLMFTTTSLKFRIYSNTRIGHALDATINNIDLNRAYHFVATYDGFEMKLYIDGVQAASKTIPLNALGPNPSYPLMIGNMAAIPDFHFSNTGTNYLIRIYDNALTENQVKYNYDRTKSRFVN